MDEEEYFFICPHCWREVSVLVDILVPHQRYIEDCENCCNPIQIEYRADPEEGVWSFEAHRLD